LKQLKHLPGIIIVSEHNSSMIVLVSLLLGTMNTSHSLESDSLCQKFLLILELGAIIPILI
jgi:hypothetical protein